MDKLLRRRSESLFDDGSFANQVSGRPADSQAGAGARGLFPVDGVERLQRRVERVMGGWRRNKSTLMGRGAGIEWIFTPDVQT